MSSNKKSPKNAKPAQFTPSGFPNSASALQGRFDVHPCAFRPGSLALFGKLLNGLKEKSKSWIPAFAGMTKYMYGLLLFSFDFRAP